MILECHNKRQPFLYKPTHELVSSKTAFSTLLSITWSFEERERKFHRDPDRLCDEIPQTFPLCFWILQPIKDGRWQRSGNKTGAGYVLHTHWTFSSLHNAFDPPPPQQICGTKMWLHICSALMSWMILMPW